MNEKTIERRLREKVKSLGGLALKFHSPYFTGMPDRMVLMPGGKIFFVELKSLDGKLSGRQKVVIPLLRNLGFSVFVVSCEDSLRYVLNEIQK
jgi:VRR-NUC domain.